MCAEQGRNDQPEHSIERVDEDHSASMRNTSWQAVQDAWTFL
jgi:hypothetical protein